MFSRKKKELMKTPSISKKSRTGSNAPQSVVAELPRKDGSESQPPLTPGPTELLAPGITKLSSSPSSSGTLKRPTSLSRHASAAGIPLTSPNSWGANKNHKPVGHSPLDSGEGPFIEPEDISQLLADVAQFAERLEKLRDVVLADEKLESRRPMAHECLGEALRILRQVITKYPLLNTIETLTAAGTLISKVKGFHYEANSETDKRDFEKALETIAVAFSSTISEFLMGEVDSSTLLSLPPGDKTQSMESLYGGIPGHGMEDVLPGATYLQTGGPSAEEVDIMLQRSEGGVDAALHYSKSMSKYMKDLIYYLEKRTTLEMEFAKGLQKLVNTCRQTVTQEAHMPFLSIYSLALEQDGDYGCGVLQAANTLQTQTFLQPLNMRRLEHEKRRKEIKELWHRAQRKLQEAESNLRKAKQGYMLRSEEHEKAKFVTLKAEDDHHNASSSATTKSLDKKRRLEEDAKGKAEEAMATYRTCIADAKTQKQELEDVKVNVLRQIQEVIKQSDQTLKSATISYYQIMHMQTAPLPVNFQTLCESSKLYDLGQQYASYVRQLHRVDDRENVYDFEPYTPQVTWSPWIRQRKSSFNTNDVASNSNEESKESGGVDGLPGQKDQRGANVERRGGRGHQVHKSWPTAISDTESAGGSSRNSSSTHSGDFSSNIPLMTSNGAVSSSEDLDVKDGNAVSSTALEESISGIGEEIPVPLPTGPFRNMGLSKAAQTHRLRKLRTPSKCRECNSYVYFQGAECEECYLACHKKCLENLAIQCGHKKLQGKLLLFGRDFLQTSQDSSDGIPFIIKKCISEIERRAMTMKGIYRVNGVKTRVEKLCQAFENGKELVELSHASPHDLSNVLKLYLRQLPEPIMPFHLYNGLMGLAKESLQGGRGKAQELVDKGPETDKEVMDMVKKLNVLLQDLPQENRATLRYIIQHLQRIAKLEQDNKMTPSNLGIVFGPTLMRPRPTEATISLSSLVDYPHQARIVEALIIFYSVLFEQEILLAQSVDGLSSGISTLQVTPEEEVLDTDYHSERFRGHVLGSTASAEQSADSDSELEDDAVHTEQHLLEGDSSLRAQKGRPRKQESETSTDDALYGDDSSEGQLSRTCSVGHSDPDVSCTRPLSKAVEEKATFPDQDTQERGDAEGQERPLSEYNTNQSNNVSLESQAPPATHCSRSKLPTVRLRNGKIAMTSSLDRHPEFF
ncbi:rho GTPase-activating protein 45 isoform X2 [Ambystoma mexicanum]|uniref:rho GTPase-activating protein 45 isoform X2 n=1 Tax=Ambystoma mexicanum TaxID=8296 RepID=UPI0037E9317D